MPIFLLKGYYYVWNNTSLDTVMWHVCMCINLNTERVLRIRSEVWCHVVINVEGLFVVLCL